MLAIVLPFLQGSLQKIRTLFKFHQRFCNDPRFFYFAKLMSWLRYKRLTDTMIFCKNTTFWESAIFYVYCRCSLNWNSVLVCSLLHKNNYNYTYSSITITITITITNIITITIYNNNYNYKYKYNYNYISLSFINTNTIRATM